MDKLIKDYVKAQETITSINLRMNTVTDEATATENAIHRLYMDARSKLDEEYREKVAGLKADAEKQKGQLNLEAQASHGVINEVKSIIRLMGIYRENPTVLQPEVYFYSDRDEYGNYISNKRKVFIEPVKTLREDKYNRIYLYIIPNGKKVNKYTLAIRGYSLFPSNKYNRGYVSRSNENHSNIRRLVKDDCSEQRLLDYMNRPANMKKIMELLPPDLNETAVAYEAAIQMYDTSTEWQKLYWEHQKEYYEESVSRGTETEEYQAILKELARLK